MLKTNVAASICLLSCVLGSPAFGWSPLQYDSTKETTSINDKSVYDEIMQRLDKQSQAEDNSGTSADKRDNAAQEETGKNQALTEDESSPAEKTNEVVEITPRIKKTPGKVPTEAITDPAYFYKRSVGYMEQGDYQSALNYVERALSLNPNYWEAWYQKALIYQLAGYDAAAARRYLALLERHPEMLPAHIALGTLYRKHQNYDLAEKEYRTAIDLSPRSFAAHFNLANVLMEEHKPELALKEYQACLRIKPDNAQAHNNIGVIYEERKYFEEAEKEFTAASHLDPANQQFQKNLDHLRAQSGRKQGQASM